MFVYQKKTQVTSKEQPITQTKCSYLLLNSLIFVLFSIKRFNQSV